jgi:hypothetical protein
MNKNTLITALPLTVLTSDVANTLAIGSVIFITILIFKSYFSLIC